MAVRWFMLDRLVCPRLEACDDAWRTLATFQDVLAQMGGAVAGRRTALTPADFCALLQGCGFRDLTLLKPG